MRISCFILILYCGLMSACTSADPHFPLEGTITPELMPLQGITNPTRIEVKPPFLIVRNSKRTDSIFHIYDLTSRKMKSVFGVRGEGPDDFVAPWLFQTPFSDIYIGDKNLVYRFGINKEGQAIFKGTKQPRFINGVDNAAFINDSLYVLDAMYMAPCVYLLSLHDELPKKTWQFRNPDMIDYYADPDMGRVFANENNIVFSYGWKKQIDFMDTGFNLIKRVKFKYVNTTIINSENQEDVNASYITGYLGKRYFYTLFLGTSWAKFSDLSFRETYLEVFDLEGNPIARYHIDGLSPIYFAVDEETFTLYGARNDGEPEDNLLVYKLKGLS